MFTFFKNKSRHKKMLATAEQYPFTGNCPVIMRTGDGAPVGRCEYSLYGNYCPTHGNLTGLLHDSREIPNFFEPIDENDLGPREQWERLDPEIYNLAASNKTKTKT